MGGDGPRFGTPSEGYAERSKRPLASLVLLVPFILAYEFASISLLRSGEPGPELRAERLLALLFDTFGLPGVALPVLAIVVVLLVHHATLGHRWSVKPGTIGVMALESLAWTLPLLVLGQLVVRLLGGVPLAAAGLIDPAVLPLGVREGLTIGIGAGLFEELIFRMALIALLHFALHDVCLVPQRHAGWLTIVLSSAAFAWYHDPWTAGGLDFAAAGFFFIAGVGFAVLYLWRGFGIAAATHSLYDILVLLVLPALRG
ncbi:MAG: CPBP family glutamic-type intramembrane protease [Planctomycetota bacterium]